MRPLALLVLLLEVTGCYGAAYDHRDVPPPPPAALGGLAQYCTSNGTTDLDEVNAFLARQSERGWVLTAVGGQMASVYCFRYEGPRPVALQVAVPRAD
jgi:hypothetical protein